MKNVFIFLFASWALVASANTLPFTETFDDLNSGSVSNQNSWTLLSGSAQVQTNFVAAGIKSLEIQSGSVTHALAGNASSVWISFQARITSAPETNPSVSNANTSVAFFVNTNRNIVAYSNEIPVELDIQIETNVWTRFDVYCNYDTLTWMLSVNSNTVAESLGLFSANTQLDSLLIVNESPAPAYFDELSIQDTEPATDLADSDNDELPDWWELRYFGGITNAASGALASNGLSNRDNYIAGLNPDDSGDRLELHRQDGRRFGWSRKEGRRYDIYWTTNLLSGFSLIHENITDSEFEESDSVRAAENSGFYQIRVKK
jgi:hypothetical protein